MLTDTLRVIVNNSFKENFYKKKKKTINILRVYYISYKSSIKTFLKWIVNYCPKSTH